MVYENVSPSRAAVTLMYPLKLVRCFLATSPSYPISLQPHEQAHMVAAVTSPKEAVDTATSRWRRTVWNSASRVTTQWKLSEQPAPTVQERNSKVALPPLRSAAPPAARDSDSVDDDDRFSLGDTTPRRLQRDLRNPNGPPLLVDLVQNTAEYASGRIADHVAPGHVARVQQRGKRRGRLP
jgi:hypothetical protein